MLKGIVRRRGWMMALAFVVALPTATSAADETGPRAQELSLPDIVLLLTDDQRADTLRYMPNVVRLLVDRGVTFTNGYVVNPLCCPSRASILTGAYSHTTGVYTNHLPLGGFHAFEDASTVATWLREAGYRTGLFGKYFNGYEDTTYVPPGWDRWFATYGHEGSYFDYTAVSDGVEQHFGSDPTDYGQTVLQREAVSFIRETPDSRPLFMYWATHAPHEAAIPAPRDEAMFQSLAPWRPKSFNEADVSDKAAHVRYRGRIDRAAAREIDRFRRDQIRSLQAVDRAVAGIVDALKDTGRLQNTLIVFMSDNGMLWGEHRLRGKSEVYEEAVTVPFVVRYDPVIAGARTDDSLVLNIDIAPTFAESGGVDAPGAEGRSLLPLLASPEAEWRDSFLIEHVRGGNNDHYASTFCAIHTDRYVLVRYATGEEELYDLSLDPHQLVNRDGSIRYQERRRALRAELRTLCDPLPPGFSF